MEEEIKIKEEIDIDVEDFDCQRYVIEFPTAIQDTSCVKQEVNVVSIAEIKNSVYGAASHFSSIFTNKNTKNGKSESVEDIHSFNDTFGICDTVSNTTSSFSNSQPNVNNKIDKDKPSEITNIDLKHILDFNASQETTSKTANQKGVCILCAATNSSKNKSITHFAQMILDLSGVNILKTETSPTACRMCFKQLNMIANFKKQIIYTNNLINNATITLKSTINNNAETSESETDDWGTSEVPNKNFPKIASSSKRSETQMANGVANRKNTHPPAKRKRKHKYSYKRKVMCAMCGNQYASMERLKTHTQDVHGEKSHLCHVCGHIFGKEKSLKNHMRIHSGEKPFTCSYCNRTFSLKWNLSQHKRLHTNSFPYKCNLCPASYRHNVTLKRHIVKFHTAAECAKSSGENFVMVEKDNSVNNEMQNNRVCKTSKI